MNVKRMERDWTGRTYHNWMDEHTHTHTQIYMHRDTCKPCITIHRSRNLSIRTHKFVGLDQTWLICPKHIDVCGYCVFAIFSIQHLKYVWQTMVCVWKTNWRQIGGLSEWMASTRLLCPHQINRIKPMSNHTKIEISLNWPNAYMCVCVCVL